jgi:hypothetical protein
MRIINNTITTVAAVIALADQGARVAPIKEALGAIGAQYQFVRLVGMPRRAVVTAIPVEVDYYPTVVGGRMSIFSVSNAKAGDVIDGYTVIYNKEVTGDGHMASYVTYIAIKL